MPILDVQMVGPPADGGAAQRIADAAGEVFGTPPGHTWVRVGRVEHYAEHGGAPAGVQPVFVSVLKADPPAERAAEAAALAAAVGAACDRPPENVHVLYEAPARGRLAFGGRLVE